MYVTSKEDILFLVAQQLIDEKARAMAEVEMFEDNPAESFRTALKSYCRIVHEYRPHIRLLYRELEVLSPERREIVMTSLSTVTSVFEKIVRKGIDKGVFADVDPKLVALNALFLCHLWSMHARALRSITQNINEFFEMQSKIILQGHACARTRGGIGDNTPLTIASPAARDRDAAITACRRGNLLQRNRAEASR